ncbi:MAG: hypothetical protein AAF460_08820, partial [Pseudomonadota bacterium]
MSKQFLILPENRDATTDGTTTGSTTTFTVREPYNFLRASGFPAGALTLLSSADQNGPFTPVQNVTLQGTGWTALPLSQRMYYQIDIGIAGTGTVDSLELRLESTTREEFEALAAATGTGATTGTPVSDGVVVAGVLTPDALNPGTGTLTLTTSLGGAININGFPIGDTFYAADGTLTSNRVVNMNGFDLTFQGGGNFTIDGKLTVTGLIDPTGLVFTGPEPDGPMPPLTIYVTDGSASGYPSGQLVFKDGGGAYHVLEREGNATTVSSQLPASYTAGAGPAAPPATPADGDVHVEHYANGSVWFSRTGGAWAETAIAGGGASDHHVVRANATASVAPNAVEVPTPIAGDTAKVQLNDGQVEYWSHNGTAWALDFTSASAVPNDRLFLSNGAVLPATAGQPTLAEATVAIGANRDTIAYYTGTNTATDTPTHVYHVDQAGAVTLLEEPNGVDAAAHHVIRANDTANVAPTALEVPSPVAGDTALVKLSDNSVEMWSYAAGAWTRDDTLPAPVQDGRSYNIQRADAVESVAPTAVEAPTANLKAGDTAYIKLTNNAVEYWSYTTAWARDFICVPATLDGNRVNVIRTNDTANVEPTAVEVPSPIDGDTAVVFLNDGVIEYWAHNGTAWALVNTVNPTVLDGSDHHVQRANDTVSVAPTAVEVPSPMNGDTAKVLLTNNTVEYWSHNGTAWALNFSVLGTVLPNRSFITETVMAPAAAGEPTIGEATTAIGTAANQLFYYNGTDTPADVPTHAWWVDNAGAVTQIESPTVDEVVTVAPTDVGNPAPAGAQWGYDPANGFTAYVDAGGNWAATPSVIPSRLENARTGGAIAPAQVLSTLVANLVADTEVSIHTTANTSFDNGGAAYTTVIDGTVTAGVTAATVVPAGVLVQVASSSTSTEPFMSYLTPANDAANHNVVRANDTANVAPTALEVPSPVSGDTAIVVLTDFTVEYWTYTAAWALDVSVPPPVQDGRSYNIARADAVENVAPTAGEAPTAGLNAGDTAYIKLTNDAVEYWSYNGTAWARDFICQPATLDGNRVNLVRA